MADIKFQMEGEISDAARSLAEFIDLQESVDKKFDGIAKSAGKASAAAGKFGRAKGKVKGIKDEVTGFNAAAEKAITSVKNWVGGFVGLSGVVRSIQNLVAEMEKARTLQKEMLGTAVDVEKTVMKTAHLRGDVSDAGIAAARSDIASVAQQAKVSLPVAAQIQFFSESAMGAGTVAAGTAAKNIAAFSGAAGLSPDEVKMIPKLFSVMKADTSAKQMKILNQVYKAAGGSIAETGEYLQPFISTAVSDIERGFTLPQSLARMTAAIETTGSVAEAGTASQRLADITAGRSERGLKFLTEQAAKKGVDFASLTDPQRMEFARAMYGDFKAAGQLDVLKTQLDVKGFASMRAMFSETGQRKYKQMLPQIEAAAGSDAVKRMAGQYESTLTAQMIGRQTHQQLTEAMTGRQRHIASDFEMMIDDIQRQAHAIPETFGESLTLAIDPESIERKKIARTLINQSLWKEYFAEQPLESGEMNPRQRRLMNLIMARPAIISQHPEYLEQVYAETDGFANMQGEEFRERAGHGIYSRALTQYFEQLTGAVKENTKAIRDLAETERSKNIVGADIGAGMD